MSKKRLLQFSCRVLQRCSLLQPFSSSRLLQPFCSATVASSVWNLEFKPGSPIKSCQSLKSYLRNLCTDLSIVHNCRNLPIFAIFDGIVAVFFLLISTRISSLFLCLDLLVDSSQLESTTRHNNSRNRSTSRAVLVMLLVA